MRRQTFVNSTTRICLLLKYIYVFIFSITVFAWFNKAQINNCESLPESDYYYMIPKFSFTYKMIVSLHCVQLLYILLGELYFSNIIMYWFWCSTTGNNPFRNMTENKMNKIVNVNFTGRQLYLDMEINQNKYIDELKSDFEKLLHTTPV